MIKFGLVGCGRIAARHAEHIVKRGKLQAVCDIKPERAESFAAQYGSKAYHSVETMLQQESDIELIAICTPNGLHAQHTIQAFQAGFHVLCEKPMAINVHECGEMIKAAETANRRLMIVKQNRFNPPVQVLKSAIDQGYLGNIFSFQLSCFWNRNPDYYNSSDWKGTHQLDGGTLFTQFSHFVDLLYWMFGDVEDVDAYIHNFDHQDTIEFEDTGVVILKFYNGVLGTINYTVNAYGGNMEGSLSVFGEKGTVKIGGQYLNELEYQKIENYTIEGLPQGKPANQYGTYTGSMSNHGEIYDNVIDVLENKGVISTNGFEGLKTIEIINKIYKIARQKR